MFVELDGRQKLIGKPATSDYRQFPERPFQIPRDMPRFDFTVIRRMLVDPTVRLALAMRAAPLHQAEFAYPVPSDDGKEKWIPGIQADDPWVANFVMKQLQRIWQFDLYKILKSQIWGWSACEVTFRLIDHKVHVDRLLHRHARDVVALTSEGEVRGVRFLRIGGETGHVDLRFPKSIWHAYDPETENAYGCSACLGAYSPWGDKWLNGGALDARRLFNYKYAYGGTRIGYPQGTTFDPDKNEEVPNRDIARQMAEQALTGAVVVHPSEQRDGDVAWPIKDVTVPATPTHIYEWPKDLDVEMNRGFEIPDDVLTSDGTGAWQGKQVPMQAFFTNGDRWLSSVITCVVTQVLEPLVLLNTGKAADFEVRTKPLAQQAMEQMAAEEEGDTVDEDAQGAIARSGGPVLGQRVDRVPFEGDVQRFGLDDEAAVGSGIIRASAMVASARRMIDDVFRAHNRLDPVALARHLNLNERETRLLVGSNGHAS